MNFDIDNLVRQILTDLTVKPEPVCIEPEKTNENYNEIYIDSRVVSLAEIQERLGIATKLFLSPKSILTPSAKDEIRKRKIEVAVKLAPLSLEQNSTGQSSTLWFSFHQPATISANFLSRLQKEVEQKQKLKQESFTTLNELLTEAERNLSNEKSRGVALTKQSATALREACRINVLRPIFGITPKQVTEDVAELNANLLIVHPNRTAETNLFDLIRTFAKNKI
jgi:hypothetical protein